MAATERQNIKPYSRTGNAAPRIVTRKIAGSQSDFISGHPFFVDGDAGTLIKSDTSDGTGDVYHVLACADQTSELDANTEIKCLAIADDILFAIHVENNGSDAAAAQTIVGGQFGIVVSTTAGQKGYCTLDANESTNVALHVDDVMGNVETGRYSLASTSKNIAIVKFLPAVIDAVRTS